MGRLKDPLIMKEYVGKLRSCLDPSTCTGLDGDVNSHWISLKDGFTRAAEPVLVNQEKGRKEWITNEAWTRVQERGKIRAQLLQSKSERLRAV